MTLTNVTAGEVTVNPDATGFYPMDIEAGMYTVVADHPCMLSDSITGIEVIAGNTNNNQQGKCVSILFKETLDKGVHRFEWNGDDISGHPIPSRFYSISLQTRSNVECIKVINNRSLMG